MTQSGLTVDEGKIMIAPGATNPIQNVLVFSDMDLSSAKLPEIERMINIAGYMRECMDHIDADHGISCAMRYVNGTPLLVYANETNEQCADAYYASCARY